MQFCVKVLVLNRSYLTQPTWKQRYPTGAWESQVGSYYNFLKVLFCIFNRYNWKYNYIQFVSPYCVTRTLANGSAASLSRDTDGNHGTIILHCQFWWHNTDYTVPFNMAEFWQLSSFSLEQKCVSYFNRQATIEYNQLSYFLTLPDKDQREPL